MEATVYRVGDVNLSQVLSVVDSFGVSADSSEEIKNGEFLKVVQSQDLVLVQAPYFVGGKEFSWPLYSGLAPQNLWLHCLTVDDAWWGYNFYTKSTDLNHQFFTGGDDWERDVYKTRMGDVANFLKVPLKDISNYFIDWDELGDTEYTTGKSYTTDSHAYEAFQIYDFVDKIMGDKKDQKFYTLAP